MNRWEVVAMVGLTLAGIAQFYMGNHFAAVLSFGAALMYPSYRGASQ